MIIWIGIVQSLFHDCFKSCNNATQSIYPFGIWKLIDCFDSTISHDYLFFLIIFICNYPYEPTATYYCTVPYHFNQEKKKEVKSWRKFNRLDQSNNDVELKYVFDIKITI